MRIQIIFKLLAVLLSFTSAYTWTTEDKCPDTIKTVVSSDPYVLDEADYRCTKKPRFTTMNAVHAALTQCPNITELDLRVTGLGCSKSPETWSFSLGPLGGERYANLKSLRVEGNDFGTRGLFKGSGSYAHENDIVWWVQTAVCALGMERLGQMASANNPIKTNLDSWLDAMNWSGLEELMVRQITDDVLAKLPPRLSSLKRLETSNISFIEALPNNTLTHLTFVGDSEYHDLESILERQGATLENLHFRLPERSTGPFLPDFNISILPSMAKNLNHISLNVPRNGTWPLDTLGIIASLPKLRAADIYMNLQSECAQQRPPLYWMSLEETNLWCGDCGEEEQYQQPRTTKEGAEKMFAHMREEKKGVELRNVTFYVGDWTRPWDGASYDPEWLGGRKEKVACSLDNEGKDGWCVVEKFKHRYDDSDDE